ncbi:hypothetical protein INS49_014042 [Diaporthe citri]|uniref:uncharacterized protein n=1 Tax=Diaporthe citri TaxID=83186 RepID=UPI001C7E2270|nr:uncharacterized protein INS49_014042 [Diaporthe citri]KAG6358158.1 hypothetical protein INS49_014042 [Diaporthe citri]
MSCPTKTTKNTYQVQKSWNQRKRGIMKKADEIRDKFEAKVALFIEKDGVLHAYQSHNNFPETVPGHLRPANRMSPNDFITVADQLRHFETGMSKPPTPASTVDLMDHIKPLPMHMHVTQTRRLFDMDF